MHPNPTSDVHFTFTFTIREIKCTITTPASRARRANVPPTTPEVVLSMKEVTEIGSGCNFCRSGNHTHADVNVSPVHTDVKVKTAGGFAGASPAESRCRLRIGTNGCRRRRWPCSLWVNLHRRECFLILLDIVAPCG